MRLADWMRRLSEILTAGGVHAFHFPCMYNPARRAREGGPVLEYLTPKAGARRHFFGADLAREIAALRKRKPEDLPLLAAVLDKKKPLRSAVATLLLEGATLEEDP